MVGLTWLVKHTRHTAHLSLPVWNQVITNVSRAANKPRQQASSPTKGGLSLILRLPLLTSQTTGFWIFILHLPVHQVFVVPMYYTVKSTSYPCKSEIKISTSYRQQHNYIYIMRGSRNFFSGGGGGGGASRPDSQKTVWTMFLVVVFFSPQLILQFTEGVQWFYYRENYTFPRIKRGSNIFQGGPNFFQGGPNAFYRNPYNMWFSRGGGGVSGPHIPPSGTAHVYIYIYILARQFETILFVTLRTQIVKMLSVTPQYTMCIIQTRKFIVSDWMKNSMCLKPGK